MRVMLHKLVDNSLYMGVMAHDYQIHKKSVQHNSDTLISPIYIYGDQTVTILSPSTTDLAITF